MRHPVTTVGSYIFGELSDSGDCPVIGVNDEFSEKEIPHGEVLCWDGRELTMIDEVDFYPKVARRLEPTTILVVGEYGQAAVYGLTGRSRHSITTRKGIPKERGPLRRGALIENTVIVVGMDRQVYRWQGGDQWETMEQGLRTKKEDVAGYEAVAGYSLSEIYAGGWDGELVHWNGKSWRRIDSPTSSIIVNMCAGGDGKVYACGRAGLLLRGRDDEWEVLEHSVMSEDFWGIAWFGDRLYLSSLNRIYSVEKGEVVPVDLGDLQNSTFYHLSSCKSSLWSVGAKDVLLFDGKKWASIA